MSGNDTVKQTMAIPENIAAKYFSEALHTVEKYHPYRKSISATYKQYSSEFKKELKRWRSTLTVNKYALLNTDVSDEIDFNLDYTGKVVITDKRCLLFCNRSIHWLPRWRG